MMASHSHSIEEGNKLLPRFDKSDFLPCVVTDYQTGELLMVAYMNKQALDLTIQTGKATYYSRSRKKIWVKGEQSGHTQFVKELLVDCDQDCIWLKVEAQGAACHVGYRSCFYRRLRPGSQDELELTFPEKVFNPEEVYAPQTKSPGA